MPRTQLVILSTHPIQYHTPWFRALAADPLLDLHVWFCHRASPREQAEAGFGVEFDWDTSLLEGYPHQFLANVSKSPSVNTYAGLDTPELDGLIRSQRPDALLVNGWHYKSAWQAMRTCWQTETPVMVRSDSHLRTRRSAVKRFAKWPYYRWFIPKLDACLAVGSWSRDYFLHYGARSERVFDVPHVIDSDFFNHASAQLKPQRSQIRESWNINPNSIVFLFAGKFTETKRPMDFVRGIELAHAKQKRIAGLMVGDGPLREQCEGYARDKKLPVAFTGFLNQSRIAEGYVAADALVLPSESETWGLVVNEAMTCGLPCFVSDQVGCSADLVAHGPSGAIFSRGDCDQLAKQLVEFADDEQQRSVMSSNALKAVARYTAREAVSGTLAALTSVNHRALLKEV